MYRYMNLSMYHCKCSYFALSLIFKDCFMFIPAGSSFKYYYINNCSFSRGSCFKIFNVKPLD